MGNTGQKSLTQMSINRQLNVLMFGLNKAGKTQMMYTGLVGNETMENFQKNEEKYFQGFKPSQGFNTELFVRKMDSFMLWDISGDIYHRQFWINYLKSIPTSIVLYVVNANESTERLQESKLYLHSLMMESSVAEAQLIVVFNTTYFQNKDADYVDNPFKQKQLEDLFQLNKLSQANWKSYVLDVRNEEYVNAMFDSIANMIRKQRAKNKRAIAASSESSKDAPAASKPAAGKAAAAGKGKASK